MTSILKENHVIEAMDATTIKWADGIGCSAILTVHSCRVLDSGDMHAMSIRRIDAYSGMLCNLRFKYLTFDAIPGSQALSPVLCVVGGEPQV